MTFMPVLGPKAHAVVRIGREALRPALGERERLELLLEARIGAGAPLPPAARVPLGTAGWRIAGPFALGVALVGGLAWFQLSPKVPVLPKPLASVSPSLAAIAPTPQLPSVPAAPETASAPSSAKTPVDLPAPRARDRLAQEVALLTRATSALRAGRTAEALKVLDEHRRNFPNGVLGLERRAVRAQALCASNRVSEGRLELAQLPPQSPAAGRAKQLCDRASSPASASESQ